MSTFVHVHHLLVADPNPAIRNLLRAVFDPERFRLSFAADGEMALGLALIDPPEILLTEMRLNGLDGASLAESLKDHPRTKGVRVLVLTTAAGEWDRQRARSAGVDGYITKPFSPAHLLRVVDRLLADFGEMEPGSRLAKVKPDIGGQLRSSRPW
jgi:CheY-like chemotaxis protein